MTVGLLIVAQVGLSVFIYVRSDLVCTRKVQVRVHENSIRIVRVRMYVAMRDGGIILKHGIKSFAHIQYTSTAILVLFVVLLLLDSSPLL